MLSAQVGRWRAYPTEVSLPLWSRRLSLRAALNQFRVIDITVKQVSPEFDLKKTPARTRTNLLKPRIAPELPIELDSRNYLKRIKAEAPVDGTEIVEWMQVAAADSAILSARADEYNRLGSQLVWSCNDPYIPGVSVEDLHYRKERGVNISNRGYGIVETPRGNFRVDAGGRGDGIFRDLLSWGAIDWVGYTQWNAALIKWRSLATTPIRDALGFASLSGLSAPQYVVLQPSRPALRVSVEQSFTSDREQRLYITWRDPSNFTRVLARDWIDIPEGTSELSYRIISFPYVPPTVYHMQPENETRTRMDYLITSP